MQLLDGEPVYSPSDLVGFAACEHLTQLELAATRGELERPQRALGEIDGAALGLRRAPDEDGELVAAEACDDVLVADGAHQPGGDAAQ